MCYGEWGSHLQCGAFSGKMPLWWVSSLKCMATIDLFCCFLDVESVGSVSQCEMLYRSNLLALVSGGTRPLYSDNILSIFDDLTKKFILEISFPSSIQAVRLAKDK